MPNQPDGIKTKFDEFRFVVGKFVLLFGITEIQLHEVIRIMLDMSPSVAVVFLNGMRIHDLTRIIRHLFEAFEQEAALKQRKLPDSIQADQVEIDDVLTQFAHINDLRNAVVHSVVAPWPDPTLETLSGTKFNFDDTIDFVATNVITARTEAAYKNIPLSKAILDAAMKDLEKIHAHLMTFTGRILSGRHPKRQRSPWEDSEKIAVLKQNAWRHKPYQPPPKRRPPRSNARKQ